MAGRGPDRLAEVRFGEAGRGLVRYGLGVTWHGRALTPPPHPGKVTGVAVPETCTIPWREESQWHSCA